MINRVNKVFIGKSISRTASAVLYGGSQAAAAGEIFVLDKTKNILAAGATVADTDTIYIAEVLADTYSYVNEAGTSVTGVKKLLFSDPIEGKNVKLYQGRSYSAITEQVVTIDSTSSTPTTGTEYSLRIVYTDTYEKPGQVTQTYRVTCGATQTYDAIWTLFIALINKDPRRRVIASGSGNLILTGRAMPYDVSDTVNAIDEYYQVNFKAHLYSNNYGDCTVTYTTAPFPGNGTWQRVRDAEKKAQSNVGVRNRTVFPIITPTMRTVASTNYGTIVIEHDRRFISADGADKTDRVTTEIYIVSGASQTVNVLNVLNPWMASTPGEFPAIINL
jgi:hypothetical protein